MYVNNIARVKVNNLFTDWFNVSSGVPQGDNEWMYELAIELKILKYGADIGGKKVCLLLYADNIVVIAKNGSDLQIQK